MKKKINAIGNKIKQLFIRKRKYYQCDSKGFQEIFGTYFEDFKFLADNAFAIRKRYRKKFEKTIYKRYKRDYKRLAKIEKLARIKL